MEAELSTD